MLRETGENVLGDALRDDRTSFTTGEIVFMNGIKVKILNVNEHSLTVRPMEQTAVELKGIPFKIHKLVGDDYVLHPIKVGQSWIIGGK